MYRIFKDNHGEIHPALLNVIMGGVCTIVVVTVGISSFLDRRNEKTYQEWARNENNIAYNLSKQERTTAKKEHKARRQLNDSFYQRLEDGLPVRILVVGDAYGSGFGASNKSSVWSKLLANKLKLTYGVNVEVKNISLSGMNGSYGAWAQLMSEPNGSAKKILDDAHAAKDKNGTYTGERVDTKTITSARKDEFDLCILSLGMTDDPEIFRTYYESILRQLRSKYQKCSVISLLSSQATTAPDSALADENAESLYDISEHYHASVINVGLEMTDPDAASRGATFSELPFGMLTSESLAASMNEDGISQSKASQVAARDLEERSERAKKNIEQYTIDGLYLNNKGQEFLADTVMRCIKNKVKSYTPYESIEVNPLSETVSALDKYSYFPVSKLQRVDSFTFVLPKKLVETANVPARALIGVDYSLTPGDNDLYVAVSDGTTGFGRITLTYQGSTNERHVLPVNDHYSVSQDGNVYLGFATETQADTLQGVIIGGDLTLPPHYDDYEHVPVIGPVDESGNPVKLDEDGKIPSENDDRDSYGNAGTGTTAYIQNAETKTTEGQDNNGQASQEQTNKLNTEDGQAAQEQATDVQTTGQSSHDQAASVDDQTSQDTYGTENTSNNAEQSISDIQQSDSYADTNGNSSNAGQEDSSDATSSGSVSGETTTDSGNNASPSSDTGTSSNETSGTSQNIRSTTETTSTDISSSAENTSDTTDAATEEISYADGPSVPN